MCSLYDGSTADVVADIYEGGNVVLDDVTQRHIVGGEIASPAGVVVELATPRTIVIGDSSARIPAGPFWQP